MYSVAVDSCEKDRWFLNEEESRMLVLTRRRDESILIDGEITVKVIRVGRGTVKLGIDAPREVRVRRGELDSPETDGSILPASAEQTQIKSA